MAEEKNRNQVPEKHKWNLSDLFASIDTWQKHKQEIESILPKIEEFKKTIVQNSQNLYDALELYHLVEKEYLRLYAYATMLSDEDTRESMPLAIKQEMSQLGTKIGAISSYIQPSILKLSRKTLDFFFEQNPKLEIYRHYIDNIYRQRQHTLKKEEEKLIAEAGLMSDTAHEIFNILSNADLPYPTIKLTSGEKVKLDPTNFTLYRMSKNQKDRIKVFDAFFTTLSKFKRTFGTQLYGEIKKNIFYKNVRKYKSCLQGALDRNNISSLVYKKLIENVNQNLSVLYRYLNIRKKMLGLDELHYYDMYPSIVKDVELEYPYSKAKAIICDSLQIMGNDYIKAIETAFTDRWIDVYPNAGKRSGAYMDGIAYDVHPYILMNYKGKYDDISTLTHELGHALHSYFSNKKQAYVNSHYPIFLAEVASIVNETLLLEYELKRCMDKTVRLSLLGKSLDNFRSTLFRQTQFAEFELLIHDITEKGEALTGDRFTELYFQLFKKYYGHEEGISFVDELYGVEWAYIPHFYYNFYVFQYSTSFTAAHSIVEYILNGDEKLVQNYLDFLSNGCADYAIPTLQKLGIDMTTNKPFEIAMKRMNLTMDAIEEIIDS